MKRLDLDNRHRILSKVFDAFKYTKDPNMLHKSLADIPQFIAGDKTILREVLHPKNDDIDLPYSIAQCIIKKGNASIPHILQKSSEVYYFLEGEGKAWIDGKSQAVKAGDTLLMPAGVEQYVENTGGNDMTFLCIVSPPWAEDEEVVL